MALLGSNFLNGCNSIPDFIATGSRMVFEQDNAPTSWTKETNAAFNNVALRVIGGANGTALSPGGNPTLGFTTAFSSSKGVNVPFSGPSGLTIAQATGFISLNSSPSSASMQPATLTVAQMTAHTHPYTFRGGADVQVGNGPAQRIYEQTLRTGSSSTTGANGAHTHSITDSGHTQHPVSTGAHSHVQTDSGHAHTFTMTQRDFNVQYMDVIICSKN
jgi:hypothetical protein